MVVVSYSGKEINAKLVYYGAGLSGKTTNLEAIYEAVPDSSRGKMVSMKTQSDRTLFFDLLPLDLGEIMGFKTRFLLYTVPGQVFYNATRKLVLKGADAIVFVADSEVGKMEENRESLANLRTNLAEYGLTLDSIPWVIQYNKRDLPNLYTVDELNAELNPANVPSFEAVASEGKGVFETFRGVSHLLMDKVTKDLRRSPGTPPRPASVPVETHASVPEIAPGPPSLARVDVPPPAPLLPLRREVQVAPAPAASEPMRIDYGAELDLSTPALENVPPALHSVSAPAAISAAPLEPARAVAPPRAVSPPPRPESVAAPASVAAASEPAGSAPPEGGTPSRQIVVPVKLAPGARYEIVIKLLLDTDG